MEHSWNLELRVYERVTGVRMYPNHDDLAGKEPKEENSTKIFIPASLADTSLYQTQQKAGGHWTSLMAVHIS
jgi:hypothetical protein